MIQPAHRRRVVLVAAWLAVAAALLAAPRTTHAHAKLLRSEPKPGSSLPWPPKAIELWFSTELEAGFNSIEVKDSTGNRFDRGEVTLGEGVKKASVELRDLPAGSYTVEWKALSADEHAIRGKFTFTVEASAAPASGEAATSPPIPPAAAQQQATPPTQERQGGAGLGDLAGEEVSTVTAADSLVRWLGYLAMMALAGGFASWLFVLGPALRSDRDEGGSREEGLGAVGVAARRSLTLFRVSVAALILSTLLALVFQSAAVYGVGLSSAFAPWRLAGIIADTGYGKSWLVQAAGAAALLAVVLLLGRAVGRDPGGGPKGLWVAGLAASAMLMLGPGLTGHAAVAAKHYGLAIFSDWLHLIAGSFWVGGLFHLALALPAALSRLAPGRRAEALGRVIPLFTKVAVPAVALLLLAGLYNTWLQLGGWGALWGTAYGRTLLVKLLLVLAMLALGAVNNFNFGRRVKRDAGGDGGPGRDTGRGFARSLRVEAALGGLVLLATAFLVFTTPGRHHATENSPAEGERPAAVGQR